MTDKIPGVPEGWKINRIDITKEGDRILFVDSEGRSKSLEVTKVNGCCGICAVILERDIKIIDMSKCKVDIEWREVDCDDWLIDKYDQMIEEFQNRVRQNHYFKLHSFDKPIPDGLDLRVERLINGILIYSRQESHTVDWNDDCSDIVGFVVEGEAEGYAYKHQIGGEE